MAVKSSYTNISIIKLRERSIISDGHEYIRNDYQQYEAYRDRI